MILSSRGFSPEGHICAVEDSSSTYHACRFLKDEISHTYKVVIVCTGVTFHHRLGQREEGWLILGHQFPTDDGRKCPDCSRILGL